MGDLVTAFPLPPRYYLSQEGDGGGVARIRTMEPPAPSGEDFACFGVPLKKEGRPVQVVECMANEGADPLFEMPVSLEGRIALLRELKNSLLLNFLQMTRLIVSGNKDEPQQRQQMETCVGDLGKCQRHAMYVLAELRRQQGLMKLRDELSRLITN